jgi:hypothetical protein
MLLPATGVNIFICIATMAVASYTPALTNISDPAPSSIFQSGFIAYDTATGEGLLPAHGSITTNFPFAVPVSGVNTIITAYGGSTIFIEFMGMCFLHVLRCPPLGVRPFVL